MTKYEFVQHYLTRVREEIVRPVVEAFVYELAALPPRAMPLFYHAVVQRKRQQLRQRFDDASKGANAWLPVIDEVALVAMLLTLGLKDTVPDASEPHGGLLKLSIDFNMEMVRLALEKEYRDRYGDEDMPNVLLLRRRN